MSEEINIKYLKAINNALVVEQKINNEEKIHTLFNLENFDKFSKLPNMSMEGLESIVNDNRRAVEFLSADKYFKNYLAFDNKNTFTDEYLEVDGYKINKRVLGLILIKEMHIDDKYKDILNHLNSIENLIGETLKYHENSIRITAENINSIIDEKEN